MVKLTVPFDINGQLYINAEVKKPESGVLADTRKAIDEGTIYAGYKKFISGSIVSFSTESETITDKGNIKAMVGDLPFKTADQLILDILMTINPDDDGVEGVYPCPLCDHKILCIENKEDDIDTRDYLSDLNREYLEEKKNITFEFSESVKVINSSNGEIIVEVESIEMRYPTINDCIKAEGRVGTRDKMKLEFAVYREALVSWNGNEADKKWKNKYAELVFRKIPDPRDLVRLNKEINKFGIDRTLKKDCPECSKNFEVQMNVSNFFYTALNPN